MHRFFVILTVCLLLFSGCSENEGYLSRDIYAMSTVISVNIPQSTQNGEELIAYTQELIYSLEKLLSATDKSSEISQFNDSKKSLELSSDTLSVIKTALDVARNTNGAYDPTCLPLTELWNVNNGGYIPSSDELENSLKKVDYSLLTMENNSLIKADPEIEIDLGGVAKGYSLQKCVEKLSEKAKYGMISFGGNVGVWGQKPDGRKWEIGIKDPFDTSDVIGYFKIDSGYVSVSGDYERFFENDGIRYHHIFDTETGYPVNNGVHSVAVYTDDAALGDTLSTALFVMGYEKAAELYEKEIYDFEALFVTDDGIHMTEGTKEIFTEK